MSKRTPSRSRLAEVDAGYQISTSSRADGTIEAVYIDVTKNRVAETREIDGDALLADFDRDGNLVGVEILAPVKLADVVRLIGPSRRRSFEKFIRAAAPQSLIRG